MGENVVEFDAVAKRYLLGEHHGAANTLRDALTGRARRLLGREPSLPRPELWALRDVTLSIAEGATVGFVGRNGAGKSTALKIVTRITEPTSGEARTRGRIGSLLEVGTGFHPELTGRENVFLNGAILGMSRQEIRRRFDEIAEFAGVERFLDTPVKRYSSGMYLRLAFSVAAHLDAEILVVDEVLAVGDAGFQRKCLARMSDLEREGRTLLFVSHNVDAIMRLCDTAVWLERGSIRAAGPSGAVVAAYLASGTAPSARKRLPPQPESAVEVQEVRLLRSDGDEASTLSRSNPFSVEVRLLVRERVPGLDMTVFLQNLRGTRVLDEAWSDACPERPGHAGEYIAGVTFPPLLSAGDYLLGLWVGTAYETLLYEEEVLQFHLEGDGAGRAERILQLGVPWDVRRADVPQGRR